MSLSKLVVVVFVLILSTEYAKAQDVVKEKELIKVDELIKLTSKEKKEKKIKEGKLIVSPYLAPGYSPELSVALSGGALVSFSTKPSDTTLLRSSVPVAFTVSSNGSYLFFSNWTTFFIRNKLYLNGIIQYRNLADHYYGVGYQSGLNTEYPDSTKYKRVYWQIYGRPMYKVSNTIYTGGIIDINFTEAKDVNERMKNDPVFIRDGARNQNVGIGYSISYDTRDFPQNAYKGASLSLNLIAYKTLGTDNKYQTVELEYKKYIPLSVKKEGRILALLFRARHAFNDVPYGELSYVGSPYDIRGYRILRYRDRVSNLMVAEYRHKFNGQSWLGQRAGFTVWVGDGSISPTSRNSLFSNHLYNYGLGFRFEVEKRLNVRVDYGRGRESSGLYFNFQEAF